MSPVRTIAELVEELFQTHLHPSGREYSLNEVSQALGGKLDTTTISKLRSGKNSNPTHKSLLLLCQFFQVSPAYFFPELEAFTPPEVAPEVQIQTAMRSIGLPAEVRANISGLINAFRKHKQDDETDK